MNGWVDRSSIQGPRGAVQWMPSNFYVGATNWLEEGLDAIFEEQIT